MRPDEILSWLRAVGEPTRLRLLALCSEGEHSVSDLAAAVGQSEPRVSRHLRILAAAGMIERLPQGQWVHYRLPRAAPAGGFALGLLGQLDRTDPLFARDRERLGSLRGEASPLGTVPGSSRLGRELSQFVEAAECARPAAVLLVGADRAELIATAALMGGRCTVIAHSRRCAQSARALAASAGLPCRVLLAATSDGLGPKDLARLDGAVDAVLLDHLAAPASALAAALAAGRRALAPGGRMWVFERYDSLDSVRDRIVEHPIARLRRLLADAQLKCERLSPIQADGQHVLAAAAVSEAAQSRRPEAANGTQRRGL